VKHIDTAVQNIVDIVSKRRNMVFGHVVRLDATYHTYMRINHLNKSLQRKLVIDQARTGTDFLDVPAWRENSGQLETNVAERIGTRTSW